MAEFTVKIDPADVAERAIDEITYKGKTIREWADALTDPKTNADRVRAMSDEELAEWLTAIEIRILQIQPMLERPALKADWLDFLKSPADGGD